MPIYFQPISETLPFSLESIGNHWGQESVSRKQGYSHYHWLQTEKGQGQVQVAGQLVTLRQGEGVLLPPYTPHAYFADEAVIEIGSRSENSTGTLGLGRAPQLINEYGIRSDHKIYQDVADTEKPLTDHLSTADKKMQTRITAGRPALSPSMACWRTIFQKYSAPIESFFPMILRSFPFPAGLTP